MYGSDKTKSGRAFATPALDLRVQAAAAFAAAALAAFAAKASDPTASSAGSWNTPYGETFASENTPFDPVTRNANGNRTIVNGRILLGEEASTLPRTLTGDLGQGLGSNSAAIGNQLNVVVNGSWNTVIVDSTQINNGDVNAGVGLNGELDLDAQ